MSEVETVAALTSGAGVLTSAVTAFVAWRVSKNSSKVELRKITAENERLQHGPREEERRNRQSTYHKFLDVLNLIFQILGTETEKDERHEICSEYNHLLSGVVLFGPPTVRDGAYALNRVYRSIWPALREEEDQHPGKAPEECWRDATAGLKTEFGDAGAKLINLMHADVTRGITES